MNIKGNDDALRGIDFSAIPELNLPLSLNAPGGSFSGDGGGGGGLFSLSLGIREKTQAALGLNLLNSSIWKLKQHELLNDMSKEYIGFHLLSPKDIFKSINSAGIQVREDDAVGRKQPLLYRISASSLFTLLFFDKDLKRILSNEAQIMLGNALTFAWWKEGLEYEIMLQSPDNLAIIQKYFYTSTHEQQEFFVKFHENFKIKSLEKGMYTDNMLDKIKFVLGLSPWCSISSVCSFLSIVKPKIGHFGSKEVRAILQILLDDHGGLEVEFLLSGAKRALEDQFLLAQAAAVLKDDPKHKELYKQCNELKRYSQIIDKTKTFGAFKDEVLAWGQQMQGEVDMGETVRAFVKKLNLAETVSDEVAGIISKTLQKLVGNLITSSEVMVPVLGYLWFIHRGGLFKYAKQAISSAIEHTVHGMLTSPGLTPTTTTTTKQLLPAG